MSTKFYVRVWYGECKGLVGYLIYRNGKEFIQLNNGRIIEGYWEAI